MTLTKETSIFNTIAENYDQLIGCIEKFHPTYAVDNSKFIITAKKAEAVCNEIRKEIKTVDPIGQFQIAYVKMDLPTMCRILNETWYGAPESRQVFNVPGFNILCDILSDFDYES